MVSKMVRLALVLAALTLCTAEIGAGSRKVLQNTDPNNGASLAVTAQNPRVDAITITPAIPYPQSAVFCNVTGDSRIPSAGAVFPLTVRVPVGVQATVVFANVTGTIPGTGTGSNSSGAAGGCSSVVQQPGTSVVQQPGSSVVQQPGSSVVQQPGSSVVQQPGSSVVQQPGSSVVQQPGSSVVQQPGSSVVQQPGTSTPGVIQPGTAAPNCTTSIVQQPSSVVQQPTSIVQQQQNSPPSSVVQQPGSSVVQQPGSSVVQQPGSSVVQQPGSSVVQQPGSSVVQQGRRLLQAPAPIEFISNNGSMGQPQLQVMDTVEGVPSISFKPTASGQTASFDGALQVAITTTNDGFGTPFIPYQVDAKLSPNCKVRVIFVTA